MSALRRPALHWLLGILLGAVFLYASADKIAHPREFAKIVYHYQLVGPSKALGFVPANVFAVTLPWTEVVVGALLVTGLWRREAAATAALMLVGFLFAVSWALLHGIDIQNCGCFTVTGEGRAAGVKLLAGDAGLLACAMVLVALAPRPATTPPPAESVPTAG